MTKKELYEKIEKGCYANEDLLDEFFSKNVVILRGENRHPYADVLHEMAERPENVTISGYGFNSYFTNFSVSDSSIMKLQFHIEPKEPVYEWQWSYTIQGIKLTTNEFMTEEEASIFDTPFIKEEQTKRERK